LISKITRPIFDPFATQLIAAPKWKSTVGSLPWRL